MDANTATKEQTALRHQLLGALVGLARASDNNPKTPDTDRVIREGLCAADPAAATPAPRLADQLARVRAEKALVAPGCLTCQSPCGNTADYDLARLYGAPAPVREQKLRLLSAVWQLARRAAALAAEDRADETLVLFFEKALFILAEDWPAEMLVPVNEEACSLLAGPLGGQA